MLSARGCVPYSDRRASLVHALALAKKEKKGRERGRSLEERLALPSNQQCHSWGNTCSRNLDSTSGMPCMRRAFTRRCCAQLSSSASTHICLAWGTQRYRCLWWWLLLAQRKVMKEHVSKQFRTCPNAWWCVLEWSHWNPAASLWFKPCAT